MMKKLFLLLVIAGWFMTGHQLLPAQSKTASGKLIYVELGGPGVYMSWNFDGRFTSDARLGFGYRLGIGFADFTSEKVNLPVFTTNNKNWPAITTDKYGIPLPNVFSFPAGLNYVFGNAGKTSTLEVGAGVTYITKKMSLYTWGKDNAGNLIGHLSFMYRLTPLNKGVSLRAGFTPMIGTAGDLFPMGAASFGYTF